MKCHGAEFAGYGPDASDPHHRANGRVTLYGSVGSKMDNDLAGIRANQIFGAFTVENKLVVDKA